MLDFYDDEKNSIGEMTIRYKISDTNELFVLNEQPSIMQNILNYVFTKEESTILNYVKDDLIELITDSHYDRLLLFLGTFPITNYYSDIYGVCDGINCETKCENPFCEKQYDFIESEKADKLYDQLQAAICCYTNYFATWGIKKVRKVDWVDFQEIKLVLERLKIEEKHFDSYKPGIENGASYVSYFQSSNEDDNIDTLVISFKGTTTILETLHDLNCRYEEFQDGFVHSGIYRLAVLFLEKNWEMMKKKINDNKLNKILLLGHSLGAALAVIVYFLLKEKVFCKNLTIKTVGFGCPPLFSRNIALREDLNIDLYTFGFDITSRMSFGSMLDLRYLFVSMGNLKSIINDKHAILKKINEIRHHIKSKDLNPKLYLPGNLYHVSKFKSSYKIKQVNCDFFDEILICGKGLLDHFVHDLANAFFEPLN
ncbi:hypothetical protein A0H76_339 [Hepatospora eriocheir]|uniref:sn-1-specific diacylglycerol lipase n=1 Tax=Hepatospora eriocheir TaxID=1081669 RepID=A0A1X0QJ09_9MICR|nr:hypothetical protein A0H76_339 [Hepatospora eriocheir]